MNAPQMENMTVDEISGVFATMTAQEIADAVAAQNMGLLIRVGMDIGKIFKSPLTAVGHPLAHALVSLGDDLAQVGEHLGPALVERYPTNSAMLTIASRIRAALMVYRG